MKPAAMTPVRVRIERRTTLPCSAESAWAWLSDVAASVHCFPQVVSCEPVVDTRTGTVAGWQVSLRTRPVGGRLVQTAYACAYTLDRAAGVIRWQPLAAHLARGTNARMSGHWTLELAASGPAAARLMIEGEIGLPIPAFAASIATPVVQAEFSQMADVYLQRVRQALAAAD